MLWQPPNREISLTRSNNRNYVFTFEDMSTPVIPIITNPPNQRQHEFYQFPLGTQFKFRAKDDVYDIVKNGTYDLARREITIAFVAADTQSITRNRRIPYEMDAIFPDTNRYTILVGDLVVFATRDLNK